MSTFRNPVGPQPARVYWRRRLVVGIGLLAVIVVVLLIIFQPRGTSGPAPTPSGSPSASSSSNASNAAMPDCDPQKVTLEPITDASGYDAGVNPKLSFTLKSSMTETCLIEVGTDIQEYRITSGDELIWSSTDCQTDAAPATTTLQPGVPKQSTPITWDRTRSSVDTCNTTREAVTAGGASYHLQVIVGDITSPTTKQFLLY